jgi:hypothetical protein
MRSSSRYPTFLPQRARQCGPTMTRPLIRPRISVSHPAASRRPRRPMSPGKSRTRLNDSIAPRRASMSSAVGSPRSNRLA